MEGEEVLKRLAMSDSFFSSHFELDALFSFAAALPLHHGQLAPCIRHMCLKTGCRSRGYSRGCHSTGCTCGHTGTLCSCHSQTGQPL